MRTKLIATSIILVGCVWLLVAFNMNTTVFTGGTFIGDTYVPGSTVHNIGLQDERRTNLLVAGLILLIGTILLAAEIIRKESSRSMPSDRKVISSDSPCAHDLDRSEYKLWLIDKYQIQRNNVLDEFVSGGQSFRTSDEAIRHAHETEIIAREQLRFSRAADEEGRRQERAERERARERAWFVAKRVAKGVTLFAMLAALALTGLFAWNRRLNGALASEVRRLDATERRIEQTKALRRAAVGKNNLLSHETQQVSVIVSRTGFDFDITVKNASNHYVKSMNGHLELQNRGVKLAPRNGDIPCCSLTPKYDKSGLNLGYALAPGEKETMKSQFRVFQFTIDTAQEERLAYEKGLEVLTSPSGRRDFAVDPNAKFVGEIEFVQTPSRMHREQKVFYSARPMDYADLSMRQGEWGRLDTEIKKLQLEVDEHKIQIQKLRRRLSYLPILP